MSTLELVRFPDSGAPLPEPLDSSRACVLQHLSEGRHARGDRLEAVGHAQHGQVAASAALYRKIGCPRGPTPFAWAPGDRCASARDRFPRSPPPGLGWHTRAMRTAGRNGRRGPPRSWTHLAAPSCVARGSPLHSGASRGSLGVPGRQGPSRGRTVQEALHRELDASSRASASWTVSPGLDLAAGNSPATRRDAPSAAASRATHWARRVRPRSRAATNDRPTRCSHGASVPAQPGWRDAGNRSRG